jgi:hypothetical protein
MSLHLRRFNDAGLIRFAEHLDAIDRGEAPARDELLENSALTATLTDVPTFEPGPLGTRREVAERLHGLLEPIADQVGDVERDRGLWAWLSLAWLDELARPAADGTRGLGAHYRYIPAIDNYRHYYRHFLAGPYRIFRAHLDDPSRAMAVLAADTTRPGDVVEQLASRQEVITSKGLMAAATALYFDEETGGIKRGAAGRKGGSARRLPIVLSQFDLTWDIYAMSAEGVLALLPSEFDRFRA